MQTFLEDKKKRINQNKAPDSINESEEYTISQPPLPLKMNRVLSLASAKTRNFFQFNNCDFETFKLRIKLVCNQSDYQRK